MKCFFSDTITKEANITGNIQYIKLNDSAESWAEEILKYANGYERKDTSAEIEASGYDIKAAARYLQELYLSAADRSN